MFLSRREKTRSNSKWASTLLRTAISKSPEIFPPRLQRKISEKGWNIAGAYAIQADVNPNGLPSPV